MLVLKKFEMDGNADTYLSMMGREEGFFSWLFSLIGLDPVAELNCNRKEILFKTSSPRKGTVNISIPNTAVTGVVTGYVKPFKHLITALVVFIGGISLAFSMDDGGAVVGVLAVLVAVAFAVSYVLQKVTTFGIYNGGDTPMAAMQFKRSVIEGVGITSEQFEAAARMLNTAVLNSQAK